MLCQKCGREIPYDSKFCGYCAHKVEDNFVVAQNTSSSRCILCGKVFYGLGDVCNDCARAETVSEKNAVDNVCAKCGKPHEMDGYYCEECANEINASTTFRKNPNAGFIAVLLSVIVLLVLISIGIAMFAGSEEEVTPVSTSSVKSSSSAPVNTSPQTKRILLNISFAKDAESHLKAELKYPETASIDYSKCTLEYNRAYCVSRGSIKYTSAQEQQVEKDFEVGMYTNADYSIAVYIKLGDKVLKDNRNLMDKDGIALEGFNLHGQYIPQGSVIYEDIFYCADFFDNDTPSSSSSNPSKNDGVMTLAKYNQIEMGMSYEEVCNIVGSNGSILSESDIAGYHTFMVMWYGKGMTGANANIIIQNDKVMTKSQIGLS